MNSPPTHQKSLVNPASSLVDVDLSSSRSMNIDDGNNDHEQEETNRNAKIMRLVLFSLLLGFIIFVIVDSLGEQNVRRITLEFLAWVEENPVAGIFSFIGVYFLATGE